MDLAELQDVIERTFGERDRARGVPATVAWLAEEVGELAQAVRPGRHSGGQSETPLVPGRPGHQIRSMSSATSSAMPSRVTSSASSSARSVASWEPVSASSKS